MIPYLRYVLLQIRHHLTALVSYRPGGLGRHIQAANFQPARRHSASGIVLRIHGYVAGHPYTIFPGNFPVADWVIHRSGRLWLLVRWDHYEEDLTMLLKELSRKRSLQGGSHTSPPAGSLLPDSTSVGFHEGRRAAGSDR